MAKAPVRVAVTGAAGQIGYAAIFRIAAGDMLGKDQPVILQLLEIPDEKAQKALKGVMMEVDDCAFPLLAGMSAHSDAMTAFKDADVALLLLDAAVAEGVTHLQPNPVLVVGVPEQFLLLQVPDPQRLGADEGLHRAPESLPVR